VCSEACSEDEDQERGGGGELGGQGDCGGGIDCSPIAAMDTLDGVGGGTAGDARSRGSSDSEFY